MWWKHESQILLSAVLSTAVHAQRLLTGETLPCGPASQVRVRILLSRGGARTERDTRDDYLYRAADFLIREYGHEGAMIRALKRREDLLAADQIAAAELWTRVVEILALH
jgi:hypothetical protein